MAKKLNIKLEDVLEIYESIRIDCPKCGKRMTPLGDPPDDPYHYCWDCKLSIPMDSTNIDEPISQKKEEP